VIANDLKTASGGEAASTITHCPVEAAIRVIGGKWKLLLLRFLLLNGPQRYNDLLAGVAGISSKELTRNLGDLSKTGLIARETENGDSAHVFYELTPLGAGLMPTFQTLLIWGQQLLPSKQD
jgi:DNA-binding HxlR family transcriptional regulator